MVGVRRFELRTSAPQTQRSTLAELHPEAAPEGAIRRYDPRRGHVNASNGGEAA